MPTTPLLDRSPAGWVTDGGLETDLIHHHGVELPEFAAYPLLGTVAGRALLRAYFLGFAAVARAAGAGLLLETPTWRANARWGARLGDDVPALRRANADAVALVRGLREDALADLPAVLTVGMVGPRGDGYRCEGIRPDEACAYHRDQVEVLADSGIDLVAAYTLSGADEAIGIVWAARTAGVPVSISFTVETDGSLPDGTSLAAALDRLQSEAPADHYLVNCAHPRHIALAVASLTSEQRALIRGVRGNASSMSHAELDNADRLDEGDPRDFGAASRALRHALPGLAILGGCCGTDTRHVAAIWGTDGAAEAPAGA
ncbi:homocysteine S-methyltransferase [Propioniciclava coleopterorum]|uniref:Homocysteine S-methyltransferase n=1 Tax=Propioniciclava coleopterorum TaxID=2714937 RepID=A0A6G7Y446_9ACTN|nr:homocysteine S-methyltransferase family protein [Propioniciclava coleopterorum]QIK71585.1 homocysteine S-methyltransferase [Propioniciclava coleopterorum]